MIKDEVVYNFNDERVITNVKTGSNLNQKTVLLTFDDGPSKHLEGILDVLAMESVPALFFWQTRLLHHKRPWKRVINEGHTIGAHSHTHPNLTTLNYEKQKKQIRLSQQMIEQITNQTVHYFRPPFGQYNHDTLEIANNHCMNTVLWDIASMDWIFKDNSEKIIQNVSDYAQDGSIILLHEFEQTLNALPSLIRVLKEKGFTFAKM